MNWKKLLTNPFKKKVYPNLIPKQKAPDKSIPPVMTPEEAVKTIPAEMIDTLKNWRSVGFNPNGKFNQEQQLELMEFIARWATMEDINAHFMGKYGLTVSKDLVYQYKHTAKWKPVIAKLREKYNLGIDEVAISSKRVRLDRAERASQMAMEKKDINAILNANRDAREEVVGNKSTNIGSVNMQFNGMSYDEIQEYKKHLLEKLTRKTIDIKPEESNG